VGEKGGRERKRGVLGGDGGEGAGGLGMEKQGLGWGRETR